MSDDGAPRGNGRFAKGQSGNPEGARVRKRKQLLTAYDFHNTVLKVAATSAQSVVNGKLQAMSMLEVNVWGLASGKPANRLASKDILELARDAKYFMDPPSARRSSGSAAIERPGRHRPFRHRVFARPGTRPCGRLFSCRIPCRSACHGAGRRQLAGDAALCCEPAPDGVALRGVGATIGIGPDSRRSSPTAFIRLVFECAAAPHAPEHMPSEVDPALLAAKGRLDEVLSSGTDEQVDAALAGYMAQLRRSA